jgi:hypothetical protein
MLAVASALAGFVTKVTPQKGSTDNLEVALRLRNNLFAWSPQFNWPPMSPNDPFLISCNAEHELLGMYSVTAVLPGLWIVLFMWNELVLWPFFQFAEGNTILLLPWDPGLQLNSVHQLFSCSFVVEMIKI